MFLLCFHVPWYNRCSFVYIFKLLVTLKSVISKILLPRASNLFLPFLILKHLQVVFLISKTTINCLKKHFFELMKNKYLLFFVQLMKSNSTNLVWLHREVLEESFSSTLYVHTIFIQKCFAQLFSSSFWLGIFWRKDIGKKVCEKFWWNWHQGTFDAAVLTYWQSK